MVSGEQLGPPTHVGAVVGRYGAGGRQPGALHQLVLCETLIYFEHYFKNGMALHKAHQL